MMRPPVTTLLAIRSRLIGDLQNHFRVIETYGADANQTIMKYRFKAVVETYFRFNDNFIELEMANTLTSDELQAMRRENHEIEDTYFLNKAILIEAIPSLDDTEVDLPMQHHPSSTFRQLNRTPTENEVTVNHRSGGKLPALSVKRFSGRSEDWEEFSDSFTSLIADNPALPESHKMHYLKISLAEAPAKIIKHLPTTANSFKSAWKLLCDSFMNKRSIIEANLDNLFAMKVLEENDADGIREIISTTNNLLSALEQQGIDTRTWSPILVYMLEHRLHEKSLQFWEESLKGSKEMPELKQMMEFLETRIHIERRNKQRKELTCSPILPEQHAVAFASQPSTTPGKTYKYRCNICNQAHLAYDCPKFLNLSVDQRIKLVTTKGLCEMCLGKHTPEQCKTRRACEECDKKHHKLLHTTQALTTQLNNGDRSDSSSEEEVDCTPEAPKRISTCVSLNTTFSSPIKALLPTAKIPILLNNKRYLVRALLDQGSQADFMSDRLCSRLNLKTIPINTVIFGLNGTETEKSTKYTSITIGSLYSKRFALELTPFVIGRITHIAPTHKGVKVNWPHLKGLNLADPDHDKEGEVDILLGAASFGTLLMTGVKKHGKHCPVAQETKLGWIISGTNRSPDNKILKAYCSFMNICSTGQVDQNQLLNDNVKKFWDLEQIQSEQKYTEEEELANLHYIRNVSRTENGQFIVKLPFNSPLTDVHIFGNSFQTAFVRFMQLEKKLLKNERLYVEYRRVMNEYIELKHMRLATLEEREDPLGYFVPHHAVVREDKTTTKVRIVFDASAKARDGKSLNELMLVGPTIQPDLLSTFLSWRRFKFVISADIEKMYRMIRIDEKEARFQKILWRGSLDEQIEQYCINTVMFGNAAAPYLAIRSLEQIAKEIETEDPKIAHTIRTQFYVDDFFGGAQIPAEAGEIAKKLTATLKKYGMNLTKWHSNSKEFFELTHQNETPTKIEMKLEGMQKALGISWSPSDDTFRFHTLLPPTPKRFTKRELCSDVMKIFDPLGWLAPFVIKAKIILQHVWLIPGLDWDDKLPECTIDSWNEYREQFPMCTQLSIPRWLHTEESNLRTELHGFADASERAYAAVVYMRTISDENEIHVTLMAAKTRLAPLKIVSLPRLELCAAVLLTQLMEKVITIMKLPEIVTHLWTDSEITLAWISSHSSRWKTFVANRVAEIHRASNPKDWKHVSSQLNPADCASRGLSMSELITHELWWTGPTFLYQEPSKWPVQKKFGPARLPEEKKSVAALQINALEPESDFLTHFSSLFGLLLTTTIARKWRKKEKQTLGPTPEDIHSATIWWIQYVQKRSFSTEWAAIKEGKSLLMRSKLIELTPIFCVDDEVLRVGGRLRRSMTSKNVRHPIILPNDSHLTALIIDDAHQRALHGGTQVTTRIIRTRYWIIQDLTVVKKRLRQCTICAKHQGKTAGQQMADLPAARVTMQRPFTHTGVDYAGYFEVKLSPIRTARTTKCYVALFICLTTKNIHIELVRDLSTQAFLEALRNFTARKGLPAHIYSDNGTNFVGAKNELPTILRNSASRMAQDVAMSLLKCNIQWHFNPARAPHFGGIWESNIKSMKAHLAKCIGGKTLLYYEFNSILIQIEAALNSRPLHPLTNDPDTEEVITPSHLLVGYGINTLPEIDLTPQSYDHLRRFEKMQHIYQVFWRQWSTEYLRQLQPRKKWARQKGNVKIGQIVIVKEDNIPPTKWLIARVINVHSGPDGLVRTAELRHGKSTFFRPIHRLCILPIPTPPPQNDAVVDFVHCPGTVVELISSPMETANRATVESDSDNPTMSCGA